jgi:hypothetical protein
MDVSIPVLCFNELFGLITSSPTRTVYITQG